MHSWLAPGLLLACLLLAVGILLLDILLAPGMLIARSWLARLLFHCAWALLGWATAQILPCYYPKAIPKPSQHYPKIPNLSWVRSRSMQYALLACSWSAAGVLVACCWHTPSAHRACPWHAQSTLLACTFALSLCLGLDGVGNGSNFALLLSQNYPKTIPTLSQNPKSILGAFLVHTIYTPGLLLVCCWHAA